MNGRRTTAPGEVELRVGRSSTDTEITLGYTLTGQRREVGFDRVLHPEKIRHADVADVTFPGYGGIADPRTHYDTRLFIDAAQAVVAARRHPASADGGGTQQFLAKLAFLASLGEAA